MRRTWLGAASALSLVLATSAADAKDWNARGTGRVTYPDDGTKPLKGARVKLMDVDIDFDDELASGTLDDDGKFDLSGRGGDPKFPFVCDDNCSKPDLAIEVELENSIVTVETELGFNWHATTNERSNTAGTVNFGSFSFASTDGKHAEVLFARMLQQYEQLRTALGDSSFRLPRHNGRVKALFPALLANGVPWTTEESMHWPGSYTDFDAVYHEFGHRLRHAQDGDFTHFLGDVVRFGYARNHNASMKTNAGFAFNEGWAEYFSTQLDAGELATFNNWTQVTGGDEVEGNVAGKLRDLHDKCGFRVMFNALRSRSIHSFAEFDAAIRATNSAPGGCLAPAIRPPFRLPPKAPLAPLLNARTGGRLFTPIAPQRQMTSLLDDADAMDRNAPSRVPMRAYHIQAKAGRTPGHQLVARVTVQREAKFRAWDAASRAAFRQQVQNLKPATPESLANQTAQKDRAAARSAFIKATVEPRLAQIADLYKSLAKERASTKDPASLAYIDTLEAKYKRAEAELRAALATVGTDDPQIAVRLLPRTLADIHQ